MIKHNDLDALDRLMKDEEEVVYSQKANHYDKHTYPLFKYYNSPKSWSKNGTVSVHCYEGKVEIRVFEAGSINVHKIDIESDGPVGARITEELDPVQE
jgi:hypothetical protein